MPEVEVGTALSAAASASSLPPSAPEESLLHGHCQGCSALEEQAAKAQAPPPREAVAIQGAEA